MCLCFHYVSTLFSQSVALFMGFESANETNDMKMMK